MKPAPPASASCASVRVSKPTSRPKTSVAPNCSENFRDGPGRHGVGERGGRAITRQALCEVDLERRGGPVNRLLPPVAPPWRTRHPAAGPWGAAARRARPHVRRKCGSSNRARRPDRKPRSKARRCPRRSCDPPRRIRGTSGRFLGEATSEARSDRGKRSPCPQERGGVCSTLAFPHRSRRSRQVAEGSAHPRLQGLVRSVRHHRDTRPCSDQNRAAKRPA